MRKSEIIELNKFGVRFFYDILHIVINPRLIKEKFLINETKKVKIKYVFSLIVILFVFDILLLLVNNKFGVIWEMVVLSFSIKLANVIVVFILSYICLILFRKKLLDKINHVSYINLILFSMFPVAITYGLSIWPLYLMLNNILYLYYGFLIMNGYTPFIQKKFRGFFIATLIFQFLFLFMIQEYLYFLISGYLVNMIR